MAITLVGVGAPFQSTSGSTVTFDVPYPTGLAVDDLLLMQVDSSVTANPTLPTGWTVFEPNLAIGSPGPTSITYFKWVTSADLSTTVVTITCPTGKYEGHMAAFRGVDTTTPKDVAAPTGTQSATGTLAVPPPITTVTAGALVLLFPASNTLTGVTTSTWSSTNMTVLVQGTSKVASTTNPSGAILSAPMASPGTFQPDVSTTSTGRSSMRVVALRPAATAPASGSASGTWTFTGAATGRPTTTPPSSGSAAGTWTFTGVAAGQPTRDVSAWSATASATTAPPAEGAATGTWTFTGTAAGRPTTTQSSSGSATGTWTFTGAASGHATAPLPASGSASGTWLFAGAASGRPTISPSASGSASGIWVYTGAAAGHGTALAASKVAVWTGTTWKPVMPMKWTGTAWVPAPVTTY